MKRSLLMLFLMLAAIPALAQFIQGKVTDIDGGSLPGAYVYYEDDTRNPVQTDDDGNYRIRFRRGTLVFSMMSFETKRQVVSKAQKLDVKLRDAVSTLGEVEVKAKRIKYSRKNNPAVDMMKRVIAAKRDADLRRNPYLSYRKYEKATFSLNEVSGKVFDEERKNKKTAFLKDHVEVHPRTGKLIMPVVVTEKVSRQFYRKDPKSEHTIVEAERSEGLNDLFNTGDILNVLLADCIQESDFYKDNVRLLQYPFISPLSSSSAIGFYRYFLNDTVMVGDDRCYRMEFSPNNPQDFGFSGTLFIRADSTWQLRRVEIGIPSRSEVNFVEHMEIVQEFDTLATGEQYVSENRMIIQFKLTDSVQKAMAELVSKMSDISFDPIPEARFKGLAVQTDPQSKHRDGEYWAENRSEQLTHSEQRMGSMLENYLNMPGLKPLLWIGKAFAENFIETTFDPRKPNRVDLGPVTNIFGSNFVEGFRLSLGAQTTANFHPHLFLRTYAKYGFKDRKWKGMGEVTWSFKAKEYMPDEFPIHKITASYTKDISSPSDKFLSVDKDNVFVALKWSPDRHKNYFERWNLLYDHEWGEGLRLQMQFNRETNQGVGDLFYQPLATGDISADPASHLPKLTFTEFTAGLQFRPGASYLNTKMKRFVSNKDAPIITLFHTVGIKGFLGGDYNYNFTEASFSKRFWAGAWGRCDVLVKGGYQWDKVPFPLLIMPAANQSYITNPRSFRLISNMEFPTDYYASGLFVWDFNGRFMNRIPLIKKLKLREFIGCNVLWGGLTDRNNPFLAQNKNDATLFHFPGAFNDDGMFETMVHPLSTRKPYVELVAGFRNILKVARIEYVHRMNYIYPGTQRWGIRGILEFSF